MDWTSANIRKQFLEFFESKGHEIVDSAPMVVKNDPTLMFTNAGMNQFKPFFLGNSNPESLRIADTQKCLRVSGKHNDLEEVGFDHYHHTMFEMLGNWSFGDYFKQEAIAWAWELLVEIYKLDPQDLYATVFAGDDGLGLNADTEAEELWQRYLPKERILRYGRKDNFWEMGEHGPCGPCSEIHVDMRSSVEKSSIPGKELVNADHPEVIEIWNLVFMQFNKLENGELLNLKHKHIDTGMGLERLVRVLQKKNSNYDTDLFHPIIKSISAHTNTTYGRSESRADISFRVIADHVRAVSFAIADGQLPSNTGAGYVIRRILRRAIRYAYSNLNTSEPFIFKVAADFIDHMGKAFPELEKSRDIIQAVIHEEEKQFLKTLQKGLERLEAFFSGSEQKIVDGKFAFELYDTFGFPIDLTQLIAAEHEFSVDTAGFERELNIQKERSRKSSVQSTGDWVEVHNLPDSEFIGYDDQTSVSRIVRYRSVDNKGKKLLQVVLDKSPFYAESGGQVGDKGLLRSEREVLKVIDTKRENDMIVHYCLLNDQFDFEAPVTAQIDQSKRSNTSKNHSLTHLIHYALREELGVHVEQKGSLVAPEKLRFDFSHFDKMGPEQMQRVERKVQSMIDQNIPLQEWRSMPRSEAEEMGAMALFGEKYGDLVRVIKFGESVELCGGTHVQASSSIQGVKITSESGVAAGVRRIEAISGDALEEYKRGVIEGYEEICSLLQVKTNPEKALQKTLEDYNSTKQKLHAAQEKLKASLTKEISVTFEALGRFKLHSNTLHDEESKMIKEAVHGAVLAHPDLVVLLASVTQGKVVLVVGAGKEAVEAGFDANALLKYASKHINGSGGGQRFLAVAGGKNPSGIPAALDAAESWITQNMKL